MWCEGSLLFREFEYGEWETSFGFNWLGDVLLWFLWLLLFPLLLLRLLFPNYDDVPTDAVGGINNGEGDKNPLSFEAKFNRFFCCVCDAGRAVETTIPRESVNYR